MSGLVQAANALRASTTIQVVIGGRSKAAADQLAAVVARQDRCQVVATVYTGREVLSAVSESVPDVAVLDLLLPDLDGLDVVSHLWSRPSKPKIILLAEQALERWAILALESGADYVLLRPVADEVVARRILQVADNVPPVPMPCPAPTAEPGSRQVSPDVVTGLLLKVGIPAHLRGYRYLREAILQIARHPDLGVTITRDLYPSLAVRFGTRPNRVERTIRHAIEVAWSRGDHEMLDDLFGNSIRRHTGRPTNGEFIHRLADMVRTGWGIVRCGGTPCVPAPLALGAPEENHFQTGIDRLRPFLGGNIWYTRWVVHPESGGGRKCRPCAGHLLLCWWPCSCSMSAAQQLPRIRMSRSS